MVRWICVLAGAAVISIIPVVAHALDICDGEYEAGESQDASPGTLAVWLAMLGMQFEQCGLSQPNYQRIFDIALKDGPCDETTPVGRSYLGGEKDVLEMIKKASEQGFNIPGYGDEMGPGGSPISKEEFCEAVRSHREELETCFARGLGCDKFGLAPG